MPVRSVVWSSSFTIVFDAESENAKTSMSLDKDKFSAQLNFPVDLRNLSLTNAFYCAFMPKNSVNAFQL